MPARAARRPAPPNAAPVPEAFAGEERFTRGGDAPFLLAGDDLDLLTGVLVSETQFPEIYKLAKENAELRMERDVLKRSVVLWVKEATK